MKLDLLRNVTGIALLMIISLPANAQVKAYQEAVNLANLWCQGT